MINTKWFKDAIIYQIYPISFKDSNNEYHFLSSEITSE